MDRMSHHGKNQCGLKVMRHLWLNFLCGLMVGELSGTLNKEVVILHCGDLELWVDKAH